MATAFGKIAPKCGAWRKSCNLKYGVKFQRKMLVKQNSIFCAAYFMLAPLVMVQIGW